MNRAPVRYGLPYQGSKNKIADWLIGCLPSARVFYDIFAGGCSVSHKALLSGKYEKIFISDINDSVKLFSACLRGELPDGSEWISRNRFYQNKDIDPYIRLIWSFGNNQKHYLYSPELEGYKHLLHRMLFSEDREERRELFKNILREQSRLGIERGGDLQSYERHLSLEKVSQSLRGISPGSWDVNIRDYRQLTFESDGIIYCDIPYKGRRKYIDREFDYDEFYDWACRQTLPVFISEYSMPENRFICIGSQRRKSSFSASNNRLQETEKLYIPRGHIEMVRELEIRQYDRVFLQTRF